FEEMGRFARHPSNRGGVSVLSQCTRRGKKGEHCYGPTRVISLGTTYVNQGRPRRSLSGEGRLARYCVLHKPSRFPPRKPAAACLRECLIRRRTDSPQRSRCIRITADGEW